MNSKEQARFDALYQQHLTELKLQGLAPATVDAYSRAVRRISNFFDCCPDRLTQSQLKTFFASLVDSHSWSTVKLDRNGLQFFYLHVLDKQWEWVRIFKPPQVRSLPDILTQEETWKLINTTRKLRYRVFFLTVYSMGLRLGEGLQLEIGNIDAAHHRVHVRMGKGKKDRYVPMPDVTLQAAARVLAYSSPSPAVLHTHSRRLDYHPHVHIIVPAGALDSNRKLWRKKKGNYLFNQDNLAKVYRAKWLQALKEHTIKVNARLPGDWVVDCKHVGSGDKALTYLARYLYRGVLSEKNILSVEDGKVTFLYTENTGATKTRILPGEEFLWLLLQHVLPKGFRRARDYGFLHPNSKSLIRLIQLLFRVTIQKHQGRLSNASTAAVL